VAKRNSMTLLLVGAAALVAAVLVLAWVSGGREPLREIVVPVEVPGESQ